MGEEPFELPKSSYGETYEKWNNKCHTAVANPTDGMAQCSWNYNEWNRSAVHSRGGTLTLKGQGRVKGRARESYTKQQDG